MNLRRRVKALEGAFVPPFRDVLRKHLDSDSTWWPSDEASLEMLWCWRSFLIQFNLAGAGSKHRDDIQRTLEFRITDQEWADCVAAHEAAMAAMSEDERRIYATAEANRYTEDA